jgi:hypothetical protein
VVSHAPAPRFRVGQRKIPARSTGRRRRLTATRAAAGACVSRSRVRSAVQQRWSEQQRRGAQHHQHEGNDARLARKNAQCRAPSQQRQNSGSSAEREHNAKAEMRSPLLTADLTSDIRRSDEHDRERERTDNHVHDPRTVAHALKAAGGDIQVTRRSQALLEHARPVFPRTTVDSGSPRPIRSSRSDTRPPSRAEGPRTRGY